MSELTTSKSVVERAVINSYPLFALVQRLASVNTQFSYTAQDIWLGSIQSDYAFEIFESADFAPLAVDNLELIVVTDPNHLGVGLTVATL